MCSQHSGALEPSSNPPKNIDIVYFSCFTYLLKITDEINPTLDSVHQSIGAQRETSKSRFFD